MEISPELFAWLASLGIINNVSSLSKEENCFVLPDKVMQQFLVGKPMAKILTYLQETYNKFYNLNLSYTDSLSEIKDPGPDNDYIPNSVKYFNWGIISEILRHFGLPFNENDVNKVIKGEPNFLIKVLEKIYSFCIQLSKKTKELKGKITPSSPAQKKEKELATGPAVKNNSKPSESINIKKIDPNKPYEQCESPLELIVVSLSRNLELKPNQSVALLSNNRKYLSILCGKGIKGNFEKINKWIEDLKDNVKLLIQLIKQWDEGLNIFFPTIGCALPSKDEQVTLNSVELLYQLQLELGVDWDWFVNEGIDAFIYSIIKQKKIRLNLLNLFYDFGKNKLAEVIQEIRKKTYSEKKPMIYDFFSEIIPIMKQTNIHFFRELESVIYDLCFSEKNDISLVLSLLSHALFCLHPIEEEMTKSIINFLKENARETRQNVSLTAVGQMFFLMDKFSDIKNSLAPILYKNLAFVFLDTYDVEAKREFFLVNFDKFFTKKPTVPIDIFLDPYIKQISNCSNYSLYDMNFIFKIIEHPRITSEQLISIIHFCLRVTLSDENYSRCANLILSLVLEKEVYKKVCDETEMREINKMFIEYIIKVIHIYLRKIKDKDQKEDKSILETAYDILGTNINEVKDGVHQDIIEAVKEYRNLKKTNSNSLLAMLWFFSNHDDVLMRIEEEHRVIYPPVVKKKKNVSIIRAENNEETGSSHTTKEKDKSKIISKPQNSEEIPLPIKNEKNEPKIGNTNVSFNLPKQLPQLKKSQSKAGLLSPENKNALMSNVSQFLKDNNSRNLGVIRKQPKQIQHSSSMAELQHNKLYDQHKKDLILEREKQKEAYKLQLLELNALQTTDQVIVKEGTLIPLGRDNNSMSQMSKQARATYITSERYKNFILPINLEEEENREILAINGYNHQYKHNIRLYFRAYADEKKGYISKASLLRMFRDKGFKKDDINLEELNIAIRNIFNENLTDFTYEQFCNIIIQLSFLIYTKKRDTLTISECYGNLLRHLNPSKLTEATIKMNKKMKPVIELIKQKLTHPKNEEDSYFNMPPGFKIKEKTSVLYNCRLPPHFLTYISESQYVCYELVEEIIFKILNSSTLEPYVKIAKSDDITIEPGELHDWSVPMTIAYINLDTDYEKIGVDCADILEEGLKNLCKGRDKKGEVIVRKAEKKLEEELKKYLEEAKQKEIIRQKRREEIKEKVEKFKEEKIKRMKERREKERIHQIEKVKLIKEQLKQSMKENYKKLQAIRERKKKIEEEKMDKIKKISQKRENEEKKKMIERKEFFNSQRLKLKQQFRLIRNQKEEMNRMKEEYYAEAEKSFSNHPAFLEKDRYYIDFDKNLNQSMRNLLKSQDIKEVFDQYKNHLQLVYKIYSKIGYKKISFFSNNSIHIDEFKEFLKNFTVLGTLIGTDQMNRIFNKITLETEKDKDMQFYLNYDEFLVSLLYVTIYSKFTDRKRRILPADLTSVNGQDVEKFFSFLGFKLPFNRLELEEFINRRRALSAKGLCQLQRTVRKEKVKEYRMTEVEKKVLNEKEEEKEKVNQTYREKVKRREEENIRDIKERKRKRKEKSDEEKRLNDNLNTDRKNSRKSSISKEPSVDPNKSIKIEKTDGSKNSKSTKKRESKSNEQEKTEKKKTESEKQPEKEEPSTPTKNEVPDPVPKEATPEKKKVKENDPQSPSPEPKDEKKETNANPEKKKKKKKKKV